MANLETLELTINGSATSASQGIDKLITSLSSLSEAIVKPYSDLVDFNNELKKMRDLSKSINLPNIAKATGARSAVAKAKKGTLDYDREHNNGRGASPYVVTDKERARVQAATEGFERNAAADYKKRVDYINWAAQRRQEMADATKQDALAQQELVRKQGEAFASMVNAEKQAMNARGEETKAIMDQSTKLDLLRLKQDALRMETISMAKEGKLTAKQIADRSMQYQKLGSEIQKLENQVNGTKEATKGLEEQTKTTAVSMKTHINGVRKSASGLLSTIGRIFKTMMIRTAIRALLKAAKEGLDNYYQYSKKMGGTFAASMDKITGKWNQIKNQLGAGVGTALSSLLPLLNAIGNVAVFVLNTLTALFALIGGKDTYTQAIEGAGDYGDTLKKTGKAAKDWLATFDELNVMTSNSGSGNGSSDFGSMFKEVELPAWMVEWKPLIEAILAGVLGATILPKIWDWVKKIFGLFSGGAAETAMDFVSNLLNKDSKLPDISKQAADMVLFGGGAAAAAAALPIVSEYISKIVEALDGVSLLGSLLGLIGELITKAMSAIPVPFKLDTKEYDEFVKKHEEWIKNKDIKTTKVVIDDDVAKITQLTLWAGTKETKKIKVEIDDDVSKITQLTLWVAEKETKTIKVEIDDDVAKITQLTLWAGTKETKTIYVEITYDIITMAFINAWASADVKKQVNIDIAYDALTMALVTAWAVLEETKKITVDIAYSALTMTLITAWAELEETKKISVDINYNALTMALITAWAELAETKTVDVDITYNALTMTLITAWAALTETKYIELKLVDNAEFYQHLVDWVNTEDVKTITVKIKQETDDSQSTGTNGTTGTNSFDPFASFKDLMSLNANQLFNRVFGTNLPEEGFLPYIFKKIIGGNNNDQKVEIEASDVLEVENVNQVVIDTRTEFIQEMIRIFGASGIGQIKSQLPNVKAEEIIFVTDWESFTLKQKLQFLKSIADAFGSKEALEAAKNCGIDVGKLISEGMKSNDPEIKKLAIEWNKLIQKNVEEPTPKVTPELKKGVVGGLSLTLKEGIEGTKATVDKINAKFAKGNPDNLKDDVNGVKATVDKIDAKFKKDNPDNLATDVSKVSATVSDITASFKKDYPGNLAKVVEGVQAKVSDITSVFKKGSPDNLKTSVEGVTGTVSASAGWKKDNPGNLKTNVEDLSPTVTAKTQFGKNALDNLVNLVQDLNPTINSGATVTDPVLQGVLNLIQALNPSITATVNTNTKGVRDSIKKAVDGIDLDLKDSNGFIHGALTLIAKANGGFVDSGDIFVANENGSAEMIGSFGHSTAVANNDQIVAGIASGVEAANAEQNALLRQQNELLRGILAKDATVQIGASSALGRVASQSLRMYGVMVGG